MALFLLANLAIGLWAGRNVKTFKDDALANRSLGVGVLTITLSATFIEAAGVQLFGPYVIGVMSLMPTVCFALVSLLLGWFVFPKLVHFKECYTLGDVMHQLYGPWARTFTAIIATLFSLLLISGQLVAAGAFSTFIGIERSTMILLVGSAVILYTFSGGVRAVSATDLLQFGLLVVGTVLLLNMALQKVGGIQLLVGEMFAKHPEKCAVWSYPDLTNRFFNAFFWAIWPTLLLTPPIIQRALMTRQKKDITQMFVGYSIFYPIFRISLALVGMCCLLVTSTQLQQPSNTDLIAYAMQYILVTPWLQALFLLTIIAVIMSTADSFLNAMAVMLIRDVYQPLFAQHNNKTQNEVFMMRALGLFIGTFAIILALFFHTTATMMSGYAVMVYSMICLPFVAGVVGLKVSPKYFTYNVLSFLVGFCLGAMLYTYLGSTSLDSTFVGGVYT